MSLSILSVEDEPLWRSLIETIVYASVEGCRCQVVSSAAAGLAFAREQEPDIVLLDLRLPDGNGIDLGEHLARLARPPRIVFLSARRDPVMLRAAGQPHISGLIWKTETVAEQLASALRELQEGRNYFPAEVREEMRRLRANPVAFFKILSGRELELLPLFGRGLTDAEIAARCALSVLTIKTHRQHTLAKLGLHRTVELIHWAIAHGFVEAPAQVQENPGVKLGA
jgi:two-component system, NarL family, response regulator DevR